MENEAASERVLASVEHSLKTYPFSYQGARIISGQEEGAFGWITVNYLSENLNKVCCFLPSNLSFLTHSSAPHRIKVQNTV